MGANNKYKNGLVCGVGISDHGKYKAYTNGKNTREYDMWQKMLARCYYDKSLKKQQTYIGCTVENHLLSFQNFCKFYNDNKWTNKLILNPDKDIICHEMNNKIYSRDTILFVDKYINTVFTRRQNYRGEFPIGISKYNNKYKAMCNDNGNPIYLGLYKTPYDAFIVYKKYKELIIKRIANEYKEKYKNFPERLYEEMINYEVLITD